eukprot:6625598-Pyramimonas_sp.AAC.1
MRLPKSLKGDSWRCNSGAGLEWYSITLDSTTLALHFDVRRYLLVTPTFEEFLSGLCDSTRVTLSPVACLQAVEEVSQKLVAVLLLHALELRCPLAHRVEHWAWVVHLPSAAHVTPEKCILKAY